VAACVPPPMTIRPPVGSVSHEALLSQPAGSPRDETRVITSSLARSGQGATVRTVPERMSRRDVQARGTPLPLPTARLTGESSLLTHTKIVVNRVIARLRSTDEDGQTLVEYGLLLALIAIILVVALLFLGPIVSRIFQNVGSNLAGS
jgi:pilus assembly protein Flp/PilA